MPYRLSEDKKAVLVNRNGKWEVLKRYTGKDAVVKALSYLRALKVNVKEQ